ncbi:unnamed protein product [Coregonus sp. 'balchen']|nr:unnamed protein product [Coregonus sp. 'balchen']
MEKEVAEMEEDTWTVEATVECHEELPSGVPPLSSSTSMPDQWEVRADEEETQQPVLKEDMTDYLKATPQDILTPVNQEDSGEEKDCGIAEAKEDEGAEHVEREGNEETEGGDEDKSGGRGGGRNEVGREPGMKGESGWRSSGAGGRKGRSRNRGGGVAASEQNTQATSSSSSSYLPKGSLSSGGGRHKQARRRNQHHHQGRGRRQTSTQLTLAFRELLSESLSPWCISCIHMVVELIVSVTHRCGVAVEAAGVALYDLCSQLLNKVTDVPGMKADARRVLERVSCAGTVLVDKSIWSVECVLQASLTCFGLLCAVVLQGSQWARFKLVRLGGERGQRWWTAVQDSKVWRRVASLVERVSGWFRRRRGTTTQVPPFTPDSPGGVGRYQPGQELERLLALAQVPEEELDPFTVLGVEAHATEAELKRAYRQLAVQVHPDKNKHPRAGEAFKVLRAAWDIVSNPETRREYELKRMAQTELSKSMNDFLTKLQDDLKEAMNTMMCTKCEGKHRRFEMDREPAEARFCAECNRRHSAEEGELWAETPPGPEHPPPGPTNPADLQDFFNRIFQGGPPPDMAANGGFFPSGPPPHQPSGAGPGPSGPFSPPPPQTGFFMPPGGPRPEPSETWAESGGKPPPRRRKKVRKPFQR